MVKYLFLFLQSVFSFKEVYGKEYCCEAMKSRAFDTGERGLTVIVEQFTYGHCFSIRVRSVDARMYKTVNTEEGVALSLVTDVTITHCPWCGVTLKDRYKNDYSELFTVVDWKTKFAP